MKKIFKKLSNKKNYLINKLNHSLFKDGTRKIIFFSISTLMILGSLAIFSTTYATAYSFLQASWSGGVSATVATTANQIGWTNYVAKDAAVTAGTTVALFATTTDSTQTSDTDFNAWTWVSGSGKYQPSGSLTMLKPNGASCSVDAECTGNWCNASNVCASCSGYKSNGYCWYKMTTTQMQNGSGGVSCATACPTC